jgi:hypothetical protein
MNNVKQNIIIRKRTHLAHNRIQWRITLKTEINFQVQSLGS